MAYEMMDGILMLIQHEKQQEVHLEMKTLRQSFMLFMLLIMNEKLQEVVIHYIREVKVVEDLIKTLVDAIELLNKQIDDKQSAEDEAKKKAVSEGVTEGGEETKQIQSAAAHGHAKDDDYDSEEEDESSEESGDELDDPSQSSPQEATLKFKAQRITLLFFTLALICENYYSSALTLVNNKSLMSQLALLMQVSEGNERDKNLKRRMVKGAAVLAASISSVQENNDPTKLQLIQKANEIQNKLNDQTGLVMNFCLNLVSLKEQTNVKCMIQTVGNLAVLGQVQENQFLLKVGLQMIINKFLGNNKAG